MYDATPNFSQNGSSGHYHMVVELPRKLHGLHSRILDNATNLYWSSWGQKNESEKMGEKWAAHFLGCVMDGRTIKSRKNTKTILQQWEGTKQQAHHWELQSLLNKIELDFYLL